MNRAHTYKYFHPDKHAYRPHPYVRTHTYTYTQVNTLIRRYTCLLFKVHTLIRTYTHVHSRTPNVHTHTYNNVHTGTHTYPFIHVHSKKINGGTLDILEPLTGMVYLHSHVPTQLHTRTLPCKHAKIRKYTIECKNSRTFAHYSKSGFSKECVSIP